MKWGVANAKAREGTADELNALWRGIDMVTDPYCPPGQAFLLNPDYMIPKLTFSNQTRNGVPWVDPETLCDDDD